MQGIPIEIGHLNGGRLDKSGRFTQACLNALADPPGERMGPAQVGARGVVRDPAVHAAVCETIVHSWAGLGGWRVLGVEESPIRGPEGNVEYLIGAVRNL